MTRKQLVQGLRTLHEDDDINNIKIDKRKNCINIEYTTSTGREGELLIAYADKRPIQTKPKSGNPFTGTAG